MTASRINMAMKMKNTPSSKQLKKNKIGWSKNIVNQLTGAATLATKSPKMRIAFLRRVATAADIKTAVIPTRRSPVANELNSMAGTTRRMKIKETSK